MGIIKVHPDFPYQEKKGVLSHSPSISEIAIIEEQIHGFKNVQQNPSQKMGAKKTNTIMEKIKLSINWPTKVEI